MNPSISKFQAPVYAATVAGGADQRSAKMDIDDFMLLLAKFNERGIHFSS